MDDDNDMTSQTDDNLTDVKPTGTTCSSSGKKRQAQSQSADSAMTPITADGVKPQKKFYRQRAHCNPLSHNTSFDYPRTPTQIDWRQDHYPNLPMPMLMPTPETTASASAAVPLAPTVLDIGCGFGGLTVALSTLLPNERILGMEIRAKVTEYVRLRILSLRKEYATVICDKQDPTTQTEKTTADKETESHVAATTNTSPLATEASMYENASVLRTNSMKYLPNYFGEASLSKLFFCFPDPHFKRKNWPRRIVSDRLLTEYAFVLRPGTGRLYTITDVKELHDWHVSKCDAHPMFERLTVHNGNESELKIDEINDPCIHAMYTETEEGKKVARNGGKKYFAVYRRIDDNHHHLDDGDDERRTANVTPQLAIQNFFDPVEEDDEEEQE
jgi:tRNA (guanine-N7-)-methyltransferase